mgnify:CR=1 FL=1
MKVSQGKAGIYMKILLINGSSRPNGCTYTALREIADTLESGGAETEILFLGSGPVRDCTGPVRRRRAAACSMTIW